MAESKNIHHQQAEAGMHEAARVSADLTTAMTAILLQSQLAIAYELRTANIIAARSSLPAENAEGHLRLTAQLYDRLGLEEER